MCVGQQGFNTLGSVLHRFRQRLCPAREDGEFLGFQYARGWRLGLGIRWRQSCAAGPNLIDGHVGIFTRVVDGAAAVGGAPRRTIPAKGEENALGTRLERNLAESSDWALSGIPGMFFFMGTV